MKPERWQQVKSAMTNALQAPSQDRARVLDEQCGDDMLLRAEVESLLAEVRREDADSGSANDSIRDAVLAEARALSTSRASTDVETLRATLQQNLGDSYDILSTLGVGGMGAVFLARERALDRYVAIKTLRAEQAVTQASRERFRREARIAAGLSHPGILPLYTFGETGGMWYLVMGYVRGQSLAQRLHAEGRLAPEEAWRILRALTDALDHAHRRQIIHRDIKPANILIDTENAQPILADFGISKVVGETDLLTRTGDVLGTPSFMSPEQLTNARACDVQSDLYALGAVGYAMVSGRVPLANIGNGDKFGRRSLSSVVPLERLCPTVAPDFVSVVMRCLATRPEDRWASAAAMRDALDRADQTVDAPFPVAVRELAGFGAYAVLWFLFWIASLFWVASIPQRAIVVLLSLLVPFALAMHVARVSSPSQRRLQLWHVAFWPPLWWGVWWPSFLRRPDDVWKRLPWPAKIIRTVMTIFVVSLPVLAFDRDGLAPDGGISWILAAGLVLALTPLALGATFLWSARLRLSRIDTLHFLLGPTAPSAFWKRRDIARLLRLTSPGVRPPQPDVPADFVRAIEDLQHSTASGSAQAMDRPVDLARRLLKAIADIDREIVALDRDAPPAELTRLNARLVMLREATHTTNSDQHHALVAIVESEIALLRDIQQRKVLAQNESAALFDVLKALYSTCSDGLHTNTGARVHDLLERGNALLNGLL